MGEEEKKGEGGGGGEAGTRSMPHNKWQRDEYPIIKKNK